MIFRPKYVVFFVLCGVTVLEAKHRRPLVDLIRISDGDAIAEESTGRIVGGTDATKNEYPYYTNWGGCGASLIAPDILLTAAHCNALPQNEVIVAAFETGTSQQGGIRRKITERRPHPNYDSTSFQNDVMLLKLDIPVNERPFAQVNRSPSTPSDNQDLVVVGMGTLQTGGGTPDVLQEVAVQVVAHRVCNGFFMYNGDIDDGSMICAGVNGGGKDSCQGDSGGPLVVKRGNGEGDVQVGIVSWGYGCARPNSPGVYTRVSSVAAWMDEALCEMASTPPASCVETNSTIAGAVPIKIQIAMDRFPTEVSWEIWQNRQVVRGVPLNSYSTPEAVVVETVYLTPGESYTFRIKDESKDGICCGYGEGNWKVVGPDDSVLASGDGKHDAMDEATFRVNGMATTSRPSYRPITVQSTNGPTTKRPSNRPTNRPNNGPTIAPTPTPDIIGEYSQQTATVRVEVLFDMYPKEVGWTIEESSSGTVVVDLPKGTFDSNVKGTQVSRSYQLLFGTEYTIQMMDGAEDGLCCDYGQGKYSVLAELGGKETVLVDSNGQYGAVDINTFVVLDGPASKRRVVTVEIDLDSQPQEIGWSIQRDNSLGGVLASRSIGTYTNERGLKTEKISIEDGLDGTLSFIVVDANGNGGPKYKVLYDDVVVVEGDGNFGLTAVHMINADDLRSRDSI